MIEDILKEEERMRIMTELLIKAHPSNFELNEDADSIFEDLQTFYDRCCENLNDNSKKKKRKKKQPHVSPTAIVDSVVQFNVRQKWPHLDGYIRPLPSGKLTSGKVLAPLVAYQCINSRGAIAHGKRPSLIYSLDNVESCTGQSVMDIFNRHGGYRTITGRKVDEIKVEIIQHGPVISFSFVPTPEFAKEHSDYIVSSRIKKHHYCMIIGWKLTEFGK